MGQTWRPSTQSCSGDGGTPLAAPRPMAGSARSFPPRKPRSLLASWGAPDEKSSVRRRLGSRARLPVDPDGTTWPSCKKRRVARLYRAAFFVAGVFMGVCLVFAGEIEEGISECRMWAAHELRTMKMHPTDEDLALPKPHRMVARAPRKLRQSYPSVMAVPVLDVTELPVAARVTP
jgi:hypothetical protein